MFEKSNKLTDRNPIQSNYDPIEQLSSNRSIEPDVWIGTQAQLHGTTAASVRKRIGQIPHRS